ncbi:DUF1657 domain-containing protein [Inediibacterium massiliense]|uniref:DUF1657 domain-containing protein n=1 Tax=Inediibacterium massiliense TaxID=1658111 RepID=UPI0006B68D45|nr:DUF1657 domain-containing protein [Inediibacterium massiliense]
MTVAAKVKQTLATLKSAQSTLQTYSIQSEDQDLKNIYEKALDVTHYAIDDLEERIKKIEFEEPQYKGY